MPRRSRRLNSRSRTFSEVAESTAPVGSSASSRRGSLASARATATRWRSPPDSCEGRWSARSASPTSCEQVQARVRGAHGDALRCRSAGLRRWLAPRAPRAAGGAGRRSRRSRAARARGAPCARSGARRSARLPRSGCSSPPISASSVLLPEPERPVITTASPGAIRSETSRSALTSPKDLLTPTTTTSAPSGVLI